MKTKVCLSVPGQKRRFASACGDRLKFRVENQDKREFSLSLFPSKKKEKKEKKWVPKQYDGKRGLPPPQPLKSFY